VPRPAPSIEDLLKDAVAQAMKKVIPAVQRHVAALAAGELEKNLAVKSGGKLPRAPARRDRASRGEITKWVANRKARRVPNFVIEMTGGLDTKKKIVAKYGEDVVFEKGRPLPKPAKAA
jgi:hypothetical protein